MRASHVQRLSLALPRRVLLAGSLALLPHCADEAPTLDGGHKLSQLNVAECDALSTWLLDLAEERLPAVGTPIVCDGARVAVQWSVTPTCPATSECTTTVAEFQRCMPAVFSMMRERFCVIARSSAAFMEATAALPECSAMCPQKLDGRSGAAALLRFGSR